MSKIDLTGQIFGRWTVLYEAESRVSKNGVKQRMWHCRCQCGCEKDVLQTSLVRGESKSCRCLAIEHIKKKNKYDLDSYDYGICYLKNDIYFLFDKEDYDLIKYYWYMNDQNYVLAYSSAEQRSIRVHRLIMNVVNNPSVDIDHRNHNTLDNRKSNLRKASHMDNLHNQKKRKTNTSGAIGVRQEQGKWRVQIKAGDKKIHIGMFSSFGEAIKARKDAEQKYFGEFAYKDNEEDVY